MLGMPRPYKGAVHAGGVRRMPQGAVQGPGMPGPKR